MSQGQQSKPSQRQIQVGQVTPILRVANFEASVAHYEDVLGFELDWNDDTFGSVFRGDANIMLCEGSQGHPGTWLYCGVSDADALHDELVSKGARIRHPPTNYPWGSRELHVFDLDGHVLRFGADADRSEPLGEWLDEAGVLWSPQPDGSWRRVE